MRCDSQFFRYALMKFDHPCITGRRFSRGSSRASAATIADPSTCARTNSESSSSTSWWPTQSLKLDRNPWPNAATPEVRSARVIAELPSIAPGCVPDNSSAPQFRLGRKPICLPLRCRRPSLRSSAQTLRSPSARTLPRSPGKRPQRHDESRTAFPYTGIRTAPLHDVPVPSRAECLDFLRLPQHALSTTVREPRRISAGRLVSRTTGMARDNAVLRRRQHGLEIATDTKAAPERIG